MKKLKLFSAVLLFGLICKAQGIFLRPDSVPIFNCSMLLPGGDITFRNPSPPKYDTVRVVMLVCDTAIYYNWYDKKDSSLFGYKMTEAAQNISPFYSKKVSYQNNLAYWQFGYQVRELVSAGWSWGDVQHGAYYEHKEYLDEKKKPIGSNIVIWMVK